MLRQFSISKVSGFNLFLVVFLLTQSCSPQKQNVIQGYDIYGKVFIKSIGKEDALKYEYHRENESIVDVCFFYESFDSIYDKRIDELLAKEFVKVKGNCGLRKLEFGVLISQKEQAIRLLSTDFAGYTILELQNGIESALLQMNISKPKCPYVVKYTYSQNIVCPVERNEKPPTYKLKHEQ